MADTSDDTSKSNCKPPKPPKPQLGNRKPSVTPNLVVQDTDNEDTANSQSVLSPQRSNSTKPEKPRPPLSRTVTPTPDLPRSPSPLPELPVSSGALRPSSGHPIPPAPRSPNLRISPTKKPSEPNTSPMLPTGSVAFEWRPSSDFDGNMPTATPVSNSNGEPPALPQRPTPAPSLQPSPSLTPNTTVSTSSASTAATPTLIQPNGSLHIEERVIDTSNTGHQPPACDIILPAQSELKTLYYLNNQCILVCTQEDVTLLAADLVPIWVVNNQSFSTCALLGTNIWIGKPSGQISCLELETGKVLFESRAAHAKKILNIWSDPVRNTVLSLCDDGKLLVWDATSFDNKPKTIRTVPTSISSSLYYNGRVHITTKNALRVYDPYGPSLYLTPRPIEWPRKAKSSTRNDFSCMSTDGKSLICGHKDGMISLFDIDTFAPKYAINTGIYAINAINARGPTWWLGLSSGNIIVIDSEKLVMLKDFKGADKGPVSALVRFELNGVELIASLGEHVALWDATLSELKKKAADKHRRLERAKTIPTTVRIFSWNVDSRNPATMAPELIRENCADGDIVVFGLQEVVELNNKTKTAKKFASGGDQTESKDYESWKHWLVMSLRSKFTIVFEKALVGLYLVVFTRASIFTRNLSSTLVKTGMGGLHGNKGAIVLSLDLDDTSLCFINCHLAAGHTQIIQRNRDAAQILETPVRAGFKPLDHDYCFFFGDTNYRINTARELAVKQIKEGNYERLDALDQLNGQRRKNPTFCLNAFKEAPLLFPPTYKFDRNSDNYDSSDKKRIPAWCDRILYRGQVEVEDYTSIKAHYSDHRPVTGLYKITVSKF